MHAPTPTGPGKHCCRKTLEVVSATFHFLFQMDACKWAWSFLHVSSFVFHKNLNFSMIYGEMSIMTVVTLHCNVYLHHKPPSWSIHMIMSYVSHNSTSDILISNKTPHIYCFQPIKTRFHHQAVSLKTTLTYLFFLQILFLFTIPGTFAHIYSDVVAK